ncbi:hypothetical protein GH714_030970 [Hevea brasiliensis]|uniref:Uncharacterized protein n=1 Tax=Hevea brasiliensis TaxID=3981 RepID=A0A6A6LHX1_HEVBR|nr:hypothetical protein GH714_030970 [Hevea brasiliensis]
MAIDVGAERSRFSRKYQNQKMNQPSKVMGNQNSKPKPINDQSFIDGKCDDHRERATEEAATLSNVESNRANVQQNPTVEIVSKLNPMAQEFVPARIRKTNSNSYYDQGKQRRNTRRTKMAQREEKIRRTAYVSEIDHQITDEQPADLFVHVGNVVDCRILNLSRIIHGSYHLRVVPSRAGIVPVNPTFLPRSEDEYDMRMRTVYCANIDKQVNEANVRLFFETCCGEV